MHATGAGSTSEEETEDMVVAITETPYDEDEFNDLGEVVLYVSARDVFEYVSEETEEGEETEEEDDEEVLESNNEGAMMMAEAVMNPDTTG